MAWSSREVHLAFGTWAPKWHTPIIQVYFDCYATIWVRCTPPPATSLRARKGVLPSSPLVGNGLRCGDVVNYEKLNKPDATLTPRKNIAIATNASSSRQALADLIQRATPRTQHKCGEPAQRRKHRAQAKTELRAWRKRRTNGSYYENSVQPGYGVEK